MKTSDAVIYLVLCGANDVKPDQAKIREMDLDSVYAFAHRHMLSAMTARALVSAGFRDQRSSQSIGQAMRREAIYAHELSRLKDQLNEEEVWFVCLKGIVLQRLYPEPWCREMADHDLLVNPGREKDVKNIMESCGFTTISYGSGTHDVYHKMPILNFEIHTELFGTMHDEKLYHYYQNVKDRLIRKERCEYVLSPEDFYIYNIAHAYKHYTLGGTGLRTLLDIYMFLKKNELDWTYVKRETEKLGISAFEKNTRELAEKTYTYGKLTESEKNELDYILSSGVHGTVRHRIENVLTKKKWSRIEYMVQRFRVPFSKKNPSYQTFASTYPFFYKHMILLPFLPFYRIFRSMKGKRFAAEAKALWKANVK